ncbi:la-related protein 4-like isoform X2 [Homarus americanus]|uniref:la-related protein 4-like isoform X2 n=1 Tax=Homarus americanus TaxID=6706 RepID=UPI001C479923|nr:la-related protein 4-like isoform X2 [Homarus americanus]
MTTVGPSDPLPGCLDADAAYVCTALAPSCFLIQKVSGGGGAVLNPEASVFHLPPALHAAHTPTTPHAVTPTINGFHSSVYPFMNGDVAKQYCGACPPTPGPMAVESPVEASTSSPNTSLPVEAGTTTGQPPGKTALVPKTTEDMAAAAQNKEQEGNAKACTSLSSSQQNGEVSPESGQPSASPLPTPLPTPPPSSRSSVSVEDGKDPDKKEEESPENKTKEHLTTSETQGTQTTPAQTPTPSTPAQTPPAQPQQSIQQTRDQIKQEVAQQVEYFFSRENLSNDPYLISQMDSDQYVPVFILANCSQFKNITKDHSIIVEALKESPFVQLDEENNRVRPNYKRCIVILREIPESTPVDEIESMFKSEECPKVVSCEFVHNSSWYVTFESDEDAQKAYWYLRGVVKTFKDKPILARIKTKPISRLGCLSVLPSYGNKGAGEGKEGTAPPSTPGSAGLQSGPGTPASSSNFNNPGNQRFMYPTPSSANANTYSYSYTTPTTPMPTAFFYPNMMQWTPPGGFYDINSFLQFNGLSPQAAFKPPTNHNIRYPNSRRNSKHRDGGRYDKGDSRHNSGAGLGNSGGSSNHGSHPGHYHPNQRPHPSHHRPQASQSPSQSSHRVSQPPPPTTGAPTPPPPPPPPPPPQPPASLSAAPGGNNHDSFAHSDFSIASQSNLYTSFSPPMVSATPVIHNIEKKEVVTVSKASSSSSTLPVSTQSLGQTATSTAAPSSSSTSMLNSSTTETPPPPTASSSSPAISSTVTTTSSTSQPPLHQQIHPPSQHQQPPPPHRHHQYQHMQQPLGPPPHRNNYGNDHYHHHHPHHMTRDPQPPRQFFENWYHHRSRGIRRRPRREEEIAMSGSGRGGMPQRGGLSQPPNMDSSKPGGNHQEVAPPPPPPPQFDLEAAAFPPLPSSDEQVPVTEEKRPPEPIPSAWGSDTQRFSDVMKGTAKPRPTSQSSHRDKELPLEPFTPTSSNSPSPSSTVTASPTVTSLQALAAANQASQAPSTSTTLPSNSVDATSMALNTSSNTSSAPTAAPTSISSTTLGNSSVSSNSSSANKVDAKPGPRDQRGVRDDRRPGSSGGPRDRRDGVRDHPRDYQRDSARNTGGRDRDHRPLRENNLRTGKENRPVTSRPWKEEKVDADGWITKGPKEPRCHREMNRDQWERPESRDTRTQHLVNGDSSPPSSPKPQKTDTKSSSEESCVEETKVTTTQPLNNNDGEHKTSWAEMAWASKDDMERLAAEVKEKDEQEKIKKQRLSTRPQQKPQEKVLISRERDGRPMRRDGPPRENRLSTDRGTTSFRPRDSARPKSPK